MKNELKVSGNQEFMGINIHIIEGGFGEDKRIVTAKTVSEIHDIEVKEITKSINRLVAKGRLTENVDYIDVISKVNSLPMDLEDVFGVKPSYLSRTSNIFILSERGYTKLIKAMDDDKSWEVMDQFVDNYFEIRKAIQEVISAKDMAIIAIVNAKNDIDRALAINRLEATVTQPLIETIEKQKPMAALAELRIHKKGCYSLTDVTQSLRLKKGQITRWAKSKSYIHKKLQEVNIAGTQFFKVYSTDGLHNSVGITEEGLQEINHKMEEIRGF